MSDASERTKYKAQVFDVALNAFFKLREFDADTVGVSRAEIGWDIAEALVAAAVSGVTYKSSNSERRFEAAGLLRALADRVEEDGLASLEWGYQGKLDARHAWRPDIRTPEGQKALDRRTDAIIEGMMRPMHALTVAERRAIVCMSFIRMALAHTGDLLRERPEEVTPVVDHAIEVMAPCLDALRAWRAEA
jgi:hypothetical protein